MTTLIKQVTIVVDGSSLGNGTEHPRAACAGLLNFRGRHRAVASFLGELTNQQAEISAAAVALEALKEPCTVTLYSDSSYVVNTMTGINQRRTNHTFWSRLDAAAAQHKIEWLWVKGHAGHAQQEAVDELARETAAAGRVNEHRLTAVAAQFNSQAAGVAAV
jgi:ribonuclease HI